MHPLKALAAGYRKVTPIPLRSTLSSVRSALVAPSPPAEELVRWNSERQGDVGLLDFDLPEKSIIIDVGAYKGRWIADMCARFRCARAIAVEPSADFAEIIRAKYGRNPDIEVHQLALGARTRVEHLAKLGDGSSIMLEADDTESVQFVDSGDWLSALGIPFIDVMMINCEGGEYELLPRLIESGWSSRIGVLMIQFHRVGDDPAAKRAVIQTALSETHVQDFSYDFVWEKWSLASRRSKLTLPPSPNPV